MDTTIGKGQFATKNPYTGKHLATYDYMDKHEIEQTIQRAHSAFLLWREKSASERSDIIKAIGEELRNYSDELSELMTDEMGKLLSQSHDEIELCAAICDYTAESAPDALKNEERQLADGGRGIITYSPIGIVYGIQPWNYPAYQVIRFSIANLMAGNSVLLKHAKNVTGTAKLLKTVYDTAGLPHGLFNVLVIDHDQSDEVIEHELVRGVTLTGSPGAGKTVAEKAAGNLKKTVLELGSNDAYLILDDADIEQAVEKCVKGRIYNNGETCIAAKRFIATEKVYADFRDHFVKAMKDLQTGDPRNENTDIGPMARKDLREKLHEQVEKSVAKGAEILCGGFMPEGESYLYPATVLGNVTKGQPAYEDELFGPVASLIKAKDNEDAMRIANDSRFGLGGGIFTTNTEAAIEMAERYFDTGMIFINSFGLAEPNMPFGGVKNSGYGREHGGFGLKEFVNVKSIFLSAED